MVLSVLDWVEGGAPLLRTEEGEGRCQKCLRGGGVKVFGLNRNGRQRTLRRGEGVLPWEKEWYTKSGENRQENSLAQCSRARKKKEMD